MFYIHTLESFIYFRSKNLKYILFHKFLFRINTKSAERSKIFSTVLNTNNRITVLNFPGLYIFICFLNEQDCPFILCTLKHAFKHLLYV